MIPKVKSWKVTFVKEDGTVLSTVVDTINKRFARSFANERLGYPAYFSKEIRVSLVK
jgi:hypothetical protein